MKPSPETSAFLRFRAIADNLIDARRLAGMAVLLGAEDRLEVSFPDGGSCTSEHLESAALYLGGRQAEAPATHFLNAFGQASALLERWDDEIYLSAGDGISALAAALAAAAHDVPVIRVGAGSRSFSRAAGLAGLASFVADHLASACLAFTGEAARILDREGVAPPLVSVVRDPLHAFVAARAPRARPTPAGLAIHLTRADPSPGVVEAIASDLPAIAGPIRVIATSEAPESAAALAETPAVAGAVKRIDCATFADVIAAIAGSEAVITDSIEGVYEVVAAGRPAVLIDDRRLPPGLAESGWVQATTAEGAAKAAIDLASVTRGDPIGDGVEDVESVFERLADVRRGGSWHRYGPFGVLPDPKPARMYGRAYRQLVRELKDAGYRFAGFPDALEPPGGRSEGPLVLMRHDVDLELGPALRMAEVEQEECVRSTFFFLMRTEHYNVFSAPGSKEIHAVLDMGHGLGLHFDCAAYPRSYGVGAVRRAVTAEVDMMRAWFGRPVEAVSFHRPNELELAGAPALTSPLPHTYMAEFTEAMQYVSDSGGSWRVGAPTELDAFQERRSLHILVHPVWWDDPPADPFRALQRFIDRRRTALERSLARNSRPFRVGWLESEE